MAFLGWYWDGEWHTYPSKEHEAKLDAVLIPMGAKRTKDIDPNFNYVEYLNQKYNEMVSSYSDR